jgi:V/A-type H+-transporting ATPase subunit I
LADKGFDKRALNLALCLFGGVSAYGIITNTYFGARLIEVNSFNADTPEGMKFLQGICFLMGAVHLTVAHVMKVMRRKIDIKVLSEIGWVIFVWGMYGIICKLIIGKGFVMPEEWVGPFFQVSLFLILVFTNPSWNIFKSILSGLGAIAQNASACFSDIVSYIRLWAVGLAGGKVAGAFNNIAEMIPSTMFMVPGIFFKVPVLVAGHAINIILGVIAILAHGVRLNLLEFSNHLELDWSGREYDPYKEIK